MFSVIGAVILGGTLAWNQTKTESNTVDVGTLSFTVAYTPNTDFIGPNDGVFRNIGKIEILNTGEFNLEFVETGAGGAGNSRVIITGVNAGQGQCAANNFIGTIVSTSDNKLPAAGPLKSVGEVQMDVEKTAPAGCIGATVSYDALLVVMTVT